MALILMDGARDASHVWKLLPMLFGTVKRWREFGNSICCQWWERFSKLDFCDATQFFLDLNGGLWFRMFCVLAWVDWNDKNIWVFDKVQRPLERI